MAKHSVPINIVQLDACTGPQKANVAYLRINVLIHDFYSLASFSLHLDPAVLNKERKLSKPLFKLPFFDKLSRVIL